MVAWTYRSTFLAFKIDEKERSASLLGLLYHRYSLDGRLGGPQNQCGYCGEEKNLSFLLGIEFQLLCHSVQNPSIY
jgi:hypothetical protein